MSWNYRVCKRKDKVNKIKEYSIREVYYDDDGQIEFYSEEAMSPYGSSLDELSDDLDMMKDALDKEIINLNKVDKKFKKK